MTIVLLIQGFPRTAGFYSYKPENNSWLHDRWVYWSIAVKQRGSHRYAHGRGVSEFMKTNFWTYLTRSSFGNNNNSMFWNCEPVLLIICLLTFRCITQGRKNIPSFVDCLNLIKHILTENDRNLHDLLGMEHKTYVQFSCSVKPHKILRELQ